MAQLLWFVWAFACAFAVRTLAVRFLAPRWGRLAGYVSGYVLWLVLFAIGLTIVWLGKLNTYGYDAADPGQFTAYVVLTYSPLGLPLVYGAPMVLLLDGVRAAFRLIRSRAAA